MPRLVAEALARRLLLGAPRREVLAVPARVRVVAKDDGGELAVEAVEGEVVGQTRPNVDAAVWNNEATRAQT